MNKHPFSEAEQWAMDMQDQIVQSVLEQFPVPPGHEKMTNKEQMAQYMNLTPDQLDAMMNQEGLTSVARYLVEMERRRQRSLQGGG